MFSFVQIPYAEASIDLTAFGNVVDPVISNIVYPVIELMFGLAVLVFAYGVLQMVFHGEEGQDRSNAKMSILYGTIGMFIMVSAWGIIYLISNTVIGAFK